MARIRSIKPEFWTSEQVADCSTTARLLFIGLWNFCDDYGVHPASAKRIKMEVFPADDITTAKVNSLVEELKAARLLIQYEAEGEQYLMVTGWSRHQKIEKPSAKYPRPGVDHSTTSRRKVADRLPPDVDVDVDVEGKSPPPSSSIDSHNSERAREEKKGESREGGPDGTAQAEPEPPERREISVQTRYVAGGAQQFAGISPNERPRANPDKADQRLAEHMTTSGYLPADKAWMLLIAARDPDNPDHIDAARQCEKYSREHRLGWFHEEAA